MLFAMDICVNKKAPPTHSVHWGLTSPHSSKTSPLLFCQAPSYISKLSKPRFLGDSPSKHVFFMHRSKNRVSQWTPMILKLFTLNRNPNF